MGGGEVGEGGPREGRGSCAMQGGLGGSTNDAEEDLDNTR